MSITNLSTEVLQKIYEYTHVQDALHLAQTSKKNYRTFLGRRMPILEQTMHNSYGPLPELLKLVLSKEHEKSRRPMGTEFRRTNMVERILDVDEDKPKLTVELMKKMVEFGKVAERWVELYPRLRWRFGSHHRRLLRQHEKLRVHRAVYNYWTYTNLFHDQAYTQFDPDFPNSSDDLRIRLVRTFSNNAMHDLSELIYHIKQLIELDLFPSNQTIQEYHSHGMPRRSLEKLAWGEQSPRYWSLFNSILKFSPDDFLYLVENTTTKAQRVAFLEAEGDEFRRTPATLNDCIATCSSLSSEMFPGCLASVNIIRGSVQEDVARWTCAQGITDVSEEEDNEIEERLRKVVPVYSSVPSKGRVRTPRDSDPF
ncbi:hypothetical protein LSUE1_G006112 [Lachnellula suecica]|uniref:F-box domain-containing protein n=1 Tax=Lachnellula suecica TaxID=602035 RepID=A0A8T9C8L9_9HELO|nr:hypothetical protein LSUE1_G006112 [Lachnellula suecica]